jgi:hypothetical protein
MQYIILMQMADASIWKEVADRAKTANEGSSRRSEAPPDLISNVYCFGALLIEIISGKLPEPDDQESMCNWVWLVKAKIPNFIPRCLDALAQL